MEYIKDNYKVWIKQYVFNTVLIIRDLKTGKQVYEDCFLPVLNSRIEAENNADRIAQDVLNSYNKRS